MEATQAADGKDSIARKGGYGLGHGIGTGKLPSQMVVPTQLRAADRAGVGLGMEAPVCGISILRRTRRTHRENLHRGLGPVIGDGLDDGKARAAVCAVDERVSCSTVLGVHEFFQAVSTEGNIRWDPGVGPLSRDTGKNSETTLREVGGKWPFFNGINSGERWSLPLQQVSEGFDPLYRAGCPDYNSGTGVTDSAGDFQTGCEGIHKGAKADSLDNAPDQQFNPFDLTLFYA